MAGYTRQSTFADGDTITAALFNNEYNQLVNAFSNTTGHSHDGTAASGPVIGLIGDAGETSPNNKVLIDTTNNYIEFYVEVSSAPVQQLYIADGAIIPVTDSDIDLGTTSLRFKDTYTDTITTTGNVAVGGNLTVTGTTTFNGGTITMGDAATDNVVFGADVDSNIIPDDDDSYDLGSSSQEWRNLYIDGTANIDSLVADTADINGGTIDGAIIGGSSAAAITGTTITGTSFVIGSADISEAELEILDGATVTTDELNILDGVTATTAELNLMDGVTSTTAELNILDGVTSTAAELNILDGVTSTAAELNILDGVTSTATELNLLDGVTATTSELNILDGVTASAGDINLIDGITNGTVIASKAIITDANKDISGGRNITITGELDAATLDISGDADIDGTLEADAITIGGITLAETISDTVGAMVSSNTETNITVSYDDADNTLDFVIGTLNQDTTGNAATATALETARTIHGVSFDGTANIDLSEVIADTVGAMVSSNTETNITVAYQDDDNTLDFTIGTLNQDTTGNAATATALETARTIGGVSFDGTANIVPTTFNAATFSGDLNVDSGVLFADVSTNRVGINQTSPDVSLDLGANTDAVHVPVGTTAERPGSPAAGYFRYNTTTSGFEGYTDSWGSIGGGGTAPILNTMTGDGSDTTLTLTSAPVNENATVVTIDGVLQHKDTYSISGTTLTFSEAPPTGTAVECITWVNTTVSSALLVQDADGDTQIQVEESSDEDKIRFDTGGTERMIIDSTGVGIGTTSPTYITEIAKSQAGGVGPTLYLHNTADNSAVGHTAEIRFNLRNAEATTRNAAIQAIAESTYGTSPALTFLTSSGDNGSATERMRITSAGLVGIGTTPVVQLHVTDSQEQLTLSEGGARGATFDYRSSTGNLNIATNGINARTSPQFTLDLNGKVGIGTSSPSQKLSVSDGMHVTEANATAADTGGSYTVSIGANASAKSLITKGNINVEGSLGIGTTSPNHDLHIQSTDPALILAQSGSINNANSGRILFAESPSFTTNNAHFEIKYDGLENHLYFGSPIDSSTDLFVVGRDGNVGIGDTAPNNKLTIRAASTIGTVNGHIMLTGDSATNGQGPQIVFSESGGSSDFAGASVGYARTGSNGIGDLIFGTRATSGDASTVPTERMRIDSSGTMILQADGAANLGRIQFSNQASTYQILGGNYIGYMGYKTGGYHRWFGSDTAEKMRLDSSGNLRINTSAGVYSGGEKMSINSTTEGLGIKTTTATKQCLGLYNSDAGGARHFVRFALGSSGNEVGNITSTGTTTAYNTSSDGRLKDITGKARGLEVINELNPVAYNWKVDGQADEGLIAQEVLDIVPNAVSGSEEEMYSMDYSKLVVHLVAGMKEQQTQIDALQSEINLLKGE